MTRSINAPILEMWPGETPASFRKRCAATGLTPNGFKAKAAQTAFVAEQKDRIRAAGYEGLETPREYQPVRFLDCQGRKRLMLLPAVLSIEQIATYCEDHPAPKYAKQSFVVTVDRVRRWWAEKLME